MGSAWHIVAFPVILPWREEFWTLPLYFPDLQVGASRGGLNNCLTGGYRCPPKPRSTPGSCSIISPET